MKVLITYFSQTGNTEKIAQAAQAELSHAGDVGLKKLEDTTPEELSEYDLVFISSPIHSGGLAGPVQEFLKALPQAPGFKMATLITHLSAAYQTQGFEKGLNTLDETAKEKQIEYLGSYDCQGKLAPAVQPAVQKARGMNDQDFKKYMDELDQHPNAEEIAGAAAFAKDIASKL